jgi:TELO2-interacting protein 2
MPQATAAAAAAVPRDALLRIASSLRECIAAAPYEPPAGSSASVKSLLAALLPPSSQPKPRAGKEAEDLLLFCAAVFAASPESPALHWVPAGLSSAAATAIEEMAAAGGWGGGGEMVREMMPEVVPPLKAVVKESCVDAEDDEIGATKPPKEHAIVAAHQFRWLVSQVCPPLLTLRLHSCQFRDL